MRTNRKMKLKFAMVMCLLAGLTANSSAKLNPRQESLKGVQAMTVEVVCSQDAKEAGLKEQDIQNNIKAQLGEAGVKIMPGQLWGTVPGRCRLKVLIKAYKPSDLDTFIYNLKIYFVQTVTLDRNPETKIDAVTWELAWLAHGSKNRLAEAIPENLKLMTVNFIKDYNTANSPGTEPSDANTRNNVSATAPKEHIRPDVGTVAVRYKYVSSKNSKVFHRPQCRSVKRIKPENLVGYNSRDEVIQAGKRPCKVCKP